MESVPADTAIIYGLDANHPEVGECRGIMAGFASLIDVVDMKSISLEKTIDAFKNDRQIKEKTVRFIKMSGVYIDSIEYMDGPETACLDDCLKLYTTYNGIRTQAVKAESSNTLNLIALASYITDAIDNGRTLVIDHFGEGVHISLLRELAGLFISDTDYRGQLIFTTQNIMMMDIRHLFRRDQIWFADRKNDDADIYPLADFSSLCNEIHSEYELLYEYQAGCFDAIPDPGYLYLDDGMGEEAWYKNRHL
ncbi:MAG: ATP-binding protein [Clostridia bacterium]|nr:ATP-binding protein [Clostridia bacterium]